MIKILSRLPTLEIDEKLLEAAPVRTLKQAIDRMNFRLQRIEVLLFVAIMAQISEDLNLLQLMGVS